jgi:aspartyl-tRNA(Asn)/glutamyl-tRNA(Gln) amidotransferase subunit A
VTQDLTRASAAELSGLYAARKASPVEVLEAVLDRAARLNPVLNALPLIDAEGARVQARASEARWAKGEPLSPIDGVPVSIKELIRVKGWPLTMASKLTDKTPQWKRDREPHHTEGAQIVYVTKTGLDYCREPATGNPRTHEAAAKWAQDYFTRTADRTARETVTAFTVDWW